MLVCLEFLGLKAPPERQEILVWMDEMVSMERTESPGFRDKREKLVII